MATQNTTTTGGYIFHTLDALIYSWSDTRNASTGGSVSVNPAASLTGVYEVLGIGKNHNILRTYLAFDLSSVTGTITAIDLVLTANANGGTVGDFIILKSSAPGLAVNLTTADFGDVDFNTTYTSNFSWTASSTNTIGLNSSAIADANTNGQLILGMVDYTHDYGNTIPSPTSPNYASIQYSSGTAPYLSYTAVTGYGNTVIGVVSANIGEVNGVATADIGTVVGV